jgi:hypothetical protein
MPDRHTGEDRYLDLFENSWIPGRATPDYDPGLPGMTIELYRECLRHQTGS